MNPLKRLAGPMGVQLIEWAVKRHPRLCLATLYRANPDLVGLWGDPADDFSWEDARLGNKVESFEDLLPLFSLNPKNRGLMRLDFDEAMLLYRRISGMTAPRGVEIGRFNGASTLLMGLAVGSEGKLTSIDIAPRDDVALTLRLLEFGLLRRVDLIVADANTVTIDPALDFVFIDGDHTYDGARKDHRRWTPLLKPGGFAFYHDMAHARPKATQVDDLKRLRQDIIDREADTIELVEEVGSISVFRRRPPRQSS